MKPCNKIPCNECPFRKNSIQGWLGRWEDPLVIHQYIMAEREFPCHLTIGTRVERHCSGAILYMNKMGKMSRNPVIWQEQVKMKPEDHSNIMTYPEFKKHHDIF